MFKILQNIYKTFSNFGTSEVRFLKKELLRWDNINSEIDKAIASNNTERLRQISKAITDEEALGPDATRMAKFSDLVERFKSTLSEDEQKKITPDELYEKFREFQKDYKEPVDLHPKKIK